MNKLLTLTCGMAVVFGLVACSNPQSTSPATTAPTSSSPTSSSQDSMSPGSTLPAYHWTLSTVTPKGQSAETAPTASDGKPLTLNFIDQRLAVRGLCNVLGGSYTLEGERMGVDHLVSTMKACPDEQLMNYERDVRQHLPTVTRWQLDNSAAAPQLILTFADGSTWTLQGEPTAATLYGGEPKRVFLEVAPERVACSHPLMPDYQCLQVREITYDDRGVKTRSGDWSNYYDQIQGYEHQPGVRNILRIDRYTRNNAPADASSTVDILDMVVESETVTAQ